MLSRHFSVRNNLAAALFFYIGTGDFVLIWLSTVVDFTWVASRGQRFHRKRWLGQVFS